MTNSDILVTWRAFLDSGGFDYVVYMLLAGSGGALASIRRNRNKKKMSEKIKSTIFEFCSSAFFGLVAGLFCGYFELDDKLTYACVAVVGHMGTKLVTKLEQQAIESATNKLKNKIN